MITAAQISKKQLIALQAIWSAHARRDISASGDPREQRLLAVGNIVGRIIGSFNDLTEPEAMRAIDALKKSLGQSTSRRARRLGRSAAQAAGTEGRRGYHGPASMASGDQVARIDAALGRLGWSAAQFSAWLRGPHGPLGGREQVRTTGDANRVWYALKRILKRQGKWNAGDAA